MCFNYGLNPILYEVLKPDKLIAHDEISNVIIDFSKHLKIEISDVPLLYYMFLRKEYKHEDDK